VPVEITDWHVDLLRTYLRQDDAKLRPMARMIGAKDELDGSGVLMWAAFVEACHRRFTRKTGADIVRFVAHARIRRGRNAPPIAPGAAEKLIISALAGTRAEGLTELQRAQHIILLSELIEDAAPTEAELEQFLTAARTYAERLAATV
jgi:hypothetical protein